MEVNNNNNDITGMSITLLSVLFYFFEKRCAIIYKKISAANANYFREKLPDTTTAGDAENLCSTFLLSKTFEVLLEPIMP